MCKTANVNRVLSLVGHVCGNHWNDGAGHHCITFRQSSEGRSKHTRGYHCGYKHAVVTLRLRVVFQPEHDTWLSSSNKLCTIICYYTMLAQEAF